MSSRGMMIIGLILGGLCILCGIAKVILLLEKDQCQDNLPNKQVPNHHVQ